MRRASPEEGCAKSRPPGDCKRDVGDSSCGIMARTQDSDQSEFRKLVSASDMLHFVSPHYSKPHVSGHLIR